MTIIVVKDKILFEDNHLLVYNKLPGEIVQGDKSGDEPVSERIKQFLKSKYQKTGNVFLGTIHRIDRPVSGIVLFAKTSKALSRMNEMLKQKQIQKTYWAVVKNKPVNESGIIEGFLKKNEEKNKSYYFEKETKGALFSELSYMLLACSDNYHLVNVNPVTGRHHQIRVMLAHIGCPIKGDVKYGDKRSNRDGSIHLHAREVKFLHPVNKSAVHIIAPPPDEPLWNYFSAIV